MQAFSGPVSVFRYPRLPETTAPAGYAALIHAYDLPVPLPRTLSAIGSRHRIIEDAGWRIYTPRHAPAASLEGHLTFALKYEGLDLAALKRLFLAVKPEEIAELVRATPTGLLRAASGSCTSGCSGASSICRPRTRSPMSMRSIPICSMPATHKTRRGIGSATTCRAPLNSARSSSRLPRSVNSSRRT